MFDRRIDVWFQEKILTNDALDLISPNEKNEMK
jgi:hypothetical protein